MKRLTILLLAVLLLSIFLLPCGNPPEWDEWQADVMERQRAGLPTEEVWTP